ncbi:MAG: nuclear transport factor 2 family protein [Clostridiales Family XIII bacterium]|nr:nuclear transport factor 2 family protein [Clostridiales Family XIII bacterium]
MEKDELKALTTRIEKLEAVHSIQNLMGRLTYMYEGGEYELMLEQFARDTPGVTAEMAGFGQAPGLAGARKVVVDFWTEQYKRHEAEMRRIFPDDANETGRNGVLDLQALSSPVTEVADDLQTAKGMWYAPTVAAECHAGAERPTAHCVWLKFAVDFVRENGEWKIWHYHILPAFNTAWDKSWVESSMEMEAVFAAVPPEARPKPLGPVTAYHAYSVHEPPANDPRPPEAYGTFSETFSY